MRGDCRANYSHNRRVNKMHIQVSMEQENTAGYRRDIYLEKKMTRPEFKALIGDLLLGADRCEVTPDSYHFAYLNKQARVGVFT